MAKGYQGTASTTTTDQHFIPEIWSEGIYKYFERKTVFRGLIDDYSAVFGGAGFGDVLSGFVSAPMGIGGGVFNVPIFKIFGYSIPVAIGSSAAIGFLTALTGAIGFAVSGS